MKDETKFETKQQTRTGKKKNRAKTKPDTRDCVKQNYTNDPMWYAVSPAVLQDVASLPFSNPVGQMIMDGQLTGSIDSIPGIGLIEFHPTLGYADGLTSAVNTAALKFYAFNRQANSGSRVSEAPDLIMYFLSVGAIYELLAAGARAYGVLRKFSNYNRYLGRVLVESMGFDYDSLSTNMANFRERFNTLIAQVNNTLHIPKGLKMFERRIFCNSNVFVDYPGKKFQLYVYKQQSYFQWHPTTYATGTAILAKPFWAKYTVDQYFEAVSNLISNLLADEDIQILSGDTWKAYGDAGCYTASELALDYEVQFIYDLPVLGQIHNVQRNYKSGDVGFVDGTTIHGKQQWYVPSEVTGGKPQFNDLPTIYQYNGMIFCRPVYTAMMQSNPHDLVALNDMILDIPAESPTPGDVMECTRFMAYSDMSRAETIDDGTGNSVRVAPIYCGSELIDNVSIISLNAAGGAQKQAVPLMALSTSDMTDSLTKYSMYSFGFDWFPLFQGRDDASGHRCTAAGDVTNFTLLQRQILLNMHEAAMYGLLDVPTLTVSR